MSITKEQREAWRRESIASHYCGQTQPHAAHTWQTPPIYGKATVIGTHQCAGLLPTIPRDTPTDDAQGGRA